MMKKLPDWILLTSVFVAACAVALCMATERLVNGASPLTLSRLHALVFGCTLLVYNIHPAVKKRRSQTVGLPQLTQYHQPVYALLAISGMAIALLALPVLSFPMVVACAVLGFISFAYTLPILPFKNKRRIRDIGWLKILSLASVWTIVTSVLPILFWHKNVFDYPYEILIRLTFIFVLCVIFDIRDIHADSASNINTLPHLIGLRNCYRLINAILAVFILLGVVQYVRHPLWYRLLAVITTAIVTRAVAEYLKKNNTERAYLIYADGLMMVYALLVLLL